MKTAGNGVFTLKSFHASSAPPPDLNAFTCPNCSNKVDKERTYEAKYKQILPFFRGYEGVPGIFLEYYPKISVADYKLIVKDSQFLERKARVCDSCYIQFTEAAQSQDKKVAARPKSNTSTNSSPPKLARSISSNTSTTSNISMPLSSTESTAKYSTSSNNSPPQSPLFTNSHKAIPLFKSSPPPTHSRATPPSRDSFTSSPPSTPPNHSAKRSAQKNGNYKDAYYLNLYEELDALRKELHELKLNEETSAEDFQRQLREKDDEIDAHKKSAARKMKQESQAKDEQIRELQKSLQVSQDEMVSLQKDHAEALEGVQREFAKKMEVRTTAWEEEKGQLEATIGKLKSEKEDVRKQSEVKLTSDRSEVLAEVEKLKNKFEMEKVVEREQLAKKYREDIDRANKKLDDRTAGLKQQVSELETSLARERQEKEKLAEEKRELAKQLELLRAKNRVESKPA